MPCTDAARPAAVADDPARAGAGRRAEVSGRWSRALRAFDGYLCLWRPAVPDRLLGGVQEPRTGHDDARRGRDFGGLFLFRGGDFRPSGRVLYWELVSLIDVMLLGHWLEMRSVIGASRALEELVRLLPDTALKLDAQGTMQEVPVSSLQPGDRALIRPGAKIPVDGVITEGESSFNEAMLTGESLPVSKKPGDVVIGGAINGAGAVTIEVKATGEKTYLSQVIEMVRQPENRILRDAEPGAGDQRFVETGDVPRGASELGAVAVIEDVDFVRWQR
jgi:E1-E2 ATPase